MVGRVGTWLEGGQTATENCLSLEPLLLTLLLLLLPPLALSSSPPLQTMGKDKLHVNVVVIGHVDSGSSHLVKFGLRAPSKESV